MGTDNMRMGICPRVVFPLTSRAVGVFDEGHNKAGRLPTVDMFRRVSGLLHLDARRLSITLERLLAMECMLGHRRGTEADGSRGSSFHLPHGIP